MIVLDKFVKELQIKLGAIPGTELDWVISFIDDNTRGSLDGTTNGTSVVTMTTGIQGIPPPQTFSGKRNIDYITVFNGDVAAQTISILYYNGTSTRTEMEVLLGVGYTLHYDENGWYVTDDDGGIVSVIVSVASIEIGDTVTGGTPKAFLYVDASGNLANSYLLEETGGLTLPNGKYFASETALQTRFNFGAGGDEFNLFTDGGLGAESKLQLTPTLFSFYADGGSNGVSGSGAGITLTSDIKVSVLSPLLLLDSGTKLQSNTNLSTIEFGAGGNEVNISTDNGAFAQSGAILTTVNASIFNSVGEFALIPTFAGITHNVGIFLDAPYYQFDQLTATTVPYINAAKKLVSSAVTPTELGYLSGVTSAIQTQFGNKQPLDSDLTSWASVTRASGFDTFTATPSSANLLTLVSDETGSGLLVFGTSPSITTPTLLLADTAPTANGSIGYDQTNKLLNVGDGTNAQKILMGSAIDFSGTAAPTGYSGTPTVTFCNYWRVGSLYFVEGDITGTSNAATLTITVPFTILRATVQPCRITDNGVASVNFGRAGSTAGSTTVAFGINASAAGGFAIIGTKRVQFALFFEV